MNDRMAALVREDKTFSEHQFCSHCGRRMRIADTELEWVFIECPKRKNFLFGSWVRHDSVITKTRMTKLRFAEAEFDTATGHRIR